MEASDPALMLARFQFAFTISFHIVLAAFSIGLANYLMVLEALWSTWTSISSGSRSLP
jgi:cytochrome d ubiquinol oxidase subunit I